MVSTNRTPVTEGLRTLAKLHDNRADVFEKQAEGLDILIEQEMDAEPEEYISPRPPNPDEYRLLARDHRVQADLFRDAAQQIENGDASPELLDQVRAFAEEIEMDGDSQFKLRDSFM